MGKKGTHIYNTCVCLPVLVYLKTNLVFLCCFCCAFFLFAFPFKFFVFFFSVPAVEHSLGPAIECAWLYGQQLTMAITSLGYYHRQQEEQEQEQQQFCLVLEFQENIKTGCW